MDEQLPGQTELILTPVSVNASWFAALKGRVTKAVVVDYHDEYPAPPDQPKPEPHLVMSTFGRSRGYWVAPPDSKIGDTAWVAQSDSITEMRGFGKTPADAIADFNAKMVAP